MEATAEDRAKVRRDECRSNGHYFNIIHTMKGPIQLVCDTCGSTWRLHPDDLEKPWGTE